MNKKQLNKKAVMIMAIAAAFFIGAFGGTAVAAGSYQAFAPRSYGTFTYDDGDASNNNGHEHDFMIDTSDLANLSGNVDSLANVTDTLNNRISALPEFIYDTEGKITGYKTKDGADTVFPFTGDRKIKQINVSYRMNTVITNPNENNLSKVFTIILYFTRDGDITVGGDSRIVNRYFAWENASSGEVIIEYYNISISYYD